MYCDSTTFRIITTIMATKISVHRYTKLEFTANPKIHNNMYRCMDHDVSSWKPHNLYILLQFFTPCFTSCVQTCNMHTHIKHNLVHCFWYNLVHCFSPQHLFLVYNYSPTLTQGLLLLWRTEQVYIREFSSCPDTYSKQCYTLHNGPKAKKEYKHFFILFFKA